MLKLCVAATAVLLIAGCQDVSAPVSGASLVGSTALATRSVNRPRSIEDEFREISNEDSTFAGVFLDDKGRPVVLHRGEPSLDRVSRATARVAMASGLWKSEEVASRRSADFTFRELDALKSQLRPMVREMEDVVGIGIDIELNRVVVRVLRGRQEVVRGRLQSTPRFAAVRFEETDEPALGQSLRSTVRPVTGGLQISSQYQGTSGYCSAGLQMWRTDEFQYPDVSQGRHIATAGHCAPPQGVVDSVQFGQPHRGMGLHLVEVANSERFNHAGCPYAPSYCQWGDIAVLKVVDSVSSTWQRVALSNTGNPPSYLGTLPLNTGMWSAVQGQPVRRVGAKSGQRNGTITRACYDLNVGGVWFLCSVEVNGHADGGDSGGPVYTPQIAQYQGSPWPSGIFFAYASQTKNPYWFTPINNALFSLTWGGPGWTF